MEVTRSRGHEVTRSVFTFRYIFPGLALGAALGQTGVVTNAMINRAAEVRQGTLQDILILVIFQALVELINEDDLLIKATFPRNVEIREIAAHIAARVFEQAVEENLKVGNSNFFKFQSLSSLMLLDREQGDAGPLRAGRHE